MKRGRPKKTRIPKKTGRPPIPIDKDRLYDFAKLGCTWSEIAAMFGFTGPDWIEKRVHADPELSSVYEKGRADVKQSIRRAQIALALKGNATMLIWLGKQMLGQTDTPKPEMAKEEPPCLKTVLSGGRVLTVAPGDNPIEKFHELVHGEKPKEAG